MRYQVVLRRTAHAATPKRTHAGRESKGDRPRSAHNVNTAVLFDREAFTKSQKRRSLKRTSSHELHLSKEAKFSGEKRSAF